MVGPRIRSALVALLMGLAVLGCGSDPDAPSSPAVPTTPPQLVAPAPLLPRDEAFRPLGPTEAAQVARVVDGDTIVVRLGGQTLRLRYIGMDTPETVKPGSPIEAMGPEASRANAALVAGRTVVLEKDVSEVDQYGRLLRYVWLVDDARWTLVNLELVRQGYAQVETDPPDVRYADRFVAAQRAAREAGLGLWGPGATDGP